MPGDEDLVFVNFINKSNGLSFGGVAQNGILSLALPAGSYAIKMLTPPNYTSPGFLPAFEITDGNAVDLGVIKLEAAEGNSKVSIEPPGGVAKALAFIIQLLFEILKELKDIAGKLNK